MFAKYTISFDDYKTLNTLIGLLELAEKDGAFVLDKEFTVYDYSYPLPDYLRGYYYNFLSFRICNINAEKFYDLKCLIDSEKDMILK